jgi:flavin-dependent dehydrogenase
VKTADVAILGGGPAGAAAAITIARYSPLKAVLLERGDYSGTRVGETIGPGIMPLLSYLGVAERVAQGNHRRGLATAAAWGSDDVLTRDFLFSGQGDGWQLDRNSFDAMLADAAREAGAIVHTRTCVRDVARGEDGLWRIAAESADGELLSLAARFLIDATGRGATAARKLGAQRETIDHLVGVVGYVSFNSGHREDEGVTLVESAPEGWWYSTWLPGDTLVVAFMSDADLLRPLAAQNVGGWTELLARARHTRARVVGGRRPSKLVTRTAASHLLRPAGGPGWLAAGDALAAFDPLSSMGIGHSLISGASAARAVEAILRDQPGPIDEYIANSGQHFAKFLKLRARFYQMEPRWRYAPFWSRRHGDGTVAQSAILHSGMASRETGACADATATEQPG